MPQQWDAEVVVDELLAAALIAEQFPELAGAPPALLGQGWDNTAYRVASDWVFRFPRHGDLHFRHLLVHDGRLSGLIDWIDLCRGDPGLDLQLAWSFFVGAERDAFFAEYGSVAEDSLPRARVLAFFLNGALTEYAHVERLPSVEREALAGLERAATAI